jgi:hypothetical protein
LGVEFECEQGDEDEPHGTLTLEVPSLVALNDAHQQFGEAKAITSPTVTNIGNLKW